MHFVYVLRSESKPTETYTGMTNCLKERLDQHNEHHDKNAHTYKYRPWKLDAYVACDTEETARIVELYFKNTAGKEKFKNFEAANPEHPNPIQGFFDTLEEGRPFGSKARRFRVTKDENKVLMVMGNQAIS